MRIINICMFIFFAVGNIAGSAEQNSLRVIKDPKFADDITMKFQKALKVISDQNPSWSDKCHQFGSNHLPVFCLDLCDIFALGTNKVKVALSQTFEQAAFEDLKQSWLNFPEDELQRLLEKVLESGFDQKATIGFLSDIMLTLIESQNLLLDAADQINQEEEKKRNLIATIEQKLYEKYCHDHSLNLVNFEEEKSRINFEECILKVLSDELSDQNFKAFCEHVRLKKSLDQNCHELLEQEQQERFAITEEFEKLKLEEKCRLNIKNLEKINILYGFRLKELDQQFEKRLKNTAVAELVQKFLRSKISENRKAAQEIKMLGSLQQQLQNKNLKKIKDVRKSNALHLQVVAAKKALRDSASSALENDQRKKLQKLYEESQLMIFGFEKELNQFDQEFDQWQKAIVLVQRFLQQKIIDQQKKECAQSFQEWTSSARKHLHEYQTCLKSFLDKHQNDVLKLMADNQAQKSNKIFKASFFQRLLTFAQEQKNNRLLQQQQAEQLPQIRQNNPYGEPFDNQEYNEVNASVVNSKYFYWTGPDDVSRAQDDQGYKYFWDTSLQKWKLVTDAQDNLTPQTEEEELQQARANGWPISTIEELKRIHELNKKVQEANQKMAEKRERIAQGLQKPPRQFLNFTKK